MTNTACHSLAALQALFFTATSLSVPDGFKWMGVMTIGMTLLYMLMYFPMWGGMFTGPKDGVTEEDYYLAEWTPEERAQVIGTGATYWATAMYQHCCNDERCRDATRSAQCLVW
eukprot:GHRR01016151.1.p1 GENE.GHRR01016151.1~~GHRR01016151.1.p1  ORF type:complete len:114 (-),score=7.94 GHRR01016151.1:1182-1523(-)